MTSKEWLDKNPGVTREQLIDELISWREKALSYKSISESQEILLAERRLNDKRHRNAEAQRNDNKTYNRWRKWFNRVFKN